MKIERNEYEIKICYHNSCTRCGSLFWTPHAFQDLCEDHLPTLESLRGVAPNATGNLSSEEFVRQLRDEWD